MVDDKPERIISDTFVRTRRPPATGRKEYRDSEVKGLALRVTANGVKSWGVRYRASGQQRRLTLGTYPAMSLKDARLEALEVLRETRKGRDLQREKAAIRRAAAPKTVAEAAGDFVDRYAKPKNRSWKEVKSLLDRHVRPAIGKRPIEDINRGDLIDLLDKVKAPHTANKTYRYVRRFFRWCQEQDFIADNPALGLTLPRPDVEQARDRVLSDAEIKELWEVWTSMGFPFGTRFKFLLLTGQRRNEAAGVRRSAIHERDTLWSIPKEATKSGRAHLVPLSPFALAVLKEVPKQKSRLVFTTNLETPIAGFSRAKARCDEIVNRARAADGREPMSPWRIHDLRRTVASGLARMKTPQIVIEKIQNRSTGEGAGVAGVYNRYSYMDERRTALDAWARHVAAIVAAGAPGTEVIDLQVWRT